MLKIKRLKLTVLISFYYLKTLIYDSKISDKFLEKEESLLIYIISIFKKQL